VPHAPGKWNLLKQENLVLWVSPEHLLCKKFTLFSYPKLSVTEVDSRLNSATGTPLAATCGANIAAGYTTEEVPTTRQRSHFSSSLAVES
jgi:hypothetical protein